ncbi:MAG: hypothetical protein HYV63_27950, partial [Candidatus Schekmanbacteria bacterium]|nr:hypothetical protein [Candidatus Schekmanbacteria bacterium]
ADPGRPAAALTYRIEAVPKYAADRASLTLATASTVFPGIATNYPAVAPGSEDDVAYRITYGPSAAPMEVALAPTGAFAYPELEARHLSPLFRDASFRVPMRYARGATPEDDREALETLAIEASTTDFGAHGHFAIQVDVEARKATSGSLPGGTLRRRNCSSFPSTTTRRVFRTTAGRCWWLPTPGRRCP